MNSVGENLERIALSLERIAKALEGNAQIVPTDKVLAQAVTRYALRQAARGSSSLAGGILSNRKPAKHDD